MGIFPILQNPKRCFTDERKQEKTAMHSAVHVTIDAASGRVSARASGVYVCTRGWTSQCRERRPRQRPAARSRCPTLPAPHPNCSRISFTRARAYLTSACARRSLAARGTGGFGAPDDLNQSNQRGTDEAGRRGASPATRSAFAHCVKRLTREKTTNEKWENPVRLVGRSS